MKISSVVLDGPLEEWVDDILNKKQVASLAELIRMCMRKARKAVDEELGRV